MEKISTIPEVSKNFNIVEGEEFDFAPSVTYRIRCGCGNIYIIIDHDEKRRFKRLSISRNSKFRCDLVMRDGLSRIATYEGKRSLRQAVKDLRGNKSHHCDNYNVTSEAVSCSDAVALALSKWIKVKRKRNPLKTPLIAMA
jgi:hypothetical protein